jgi:hypothetical protein
MWFQNDIYGENPTNSETFILLRMRRNSLLAASDHRMLPDTPWDTEPWAVYRQALRDLPEQTADPREAVWPDPPTD